MHTSVQIAAIKRIQAAFSFLALLNINGHLYPQEATISNEASYDFIVAGGGGAGVVMAARLVEANFNVLLIEAGDNPGLENNYPGFVTYVKESRLDWNFTAEDDLTKCHAASGYLFGKVLGGSGQTNDMLYARGHPQDYERFYKATNDSSWKWENMLKYFLKSQNLTDIDVLSSAYKEYHSNNGTIAVSKENHQVVDDYLQGFEQNGESIVVDNIGAGTLGYSSAMFYVNEGNRTEAASAYLIPLRNNTRLHVTRNSTVTKIIIDENNKAVGVEFVKEGETYAVNATKEVIVSAGPVKSPQLLMLSGIGPEEELQKWNISVISNLAVGKNLQNIVGAFLGFRTNKEAKPETLNPNDYPAPMFVGYSALDKSCSIPQYETLSKIINDSAYLLSLCGFTLGFKNSICHKLDELSNNTEVLVTVINNIHPKSVGEVTLHSTDPFDKPKIYNGYYSNKDDLDAIVEYILDFIKIESAPYFQDLQLEFLEIASKCGNITFGTREYWECYASCMITPSDGFCGTCALGSVVDNEFKVKGVDTLRVVDASVMPNTVGGPIYASVIALAEKAAELVVGSYNS